MLQCEPKARIIARSVAQQFVTLSIEYLGTISTVCKVPSSVDPDDPIFVVLEVFLASIFVFLTDTIIGAIVVVIIVCNPTSFHPVLNMSVIQVQLFLSLYPISSVYLG